MSWIIYKHTNTINGKVYIGQTRRTPNERWRNGRGYTFNKNTRFCQAILKYGWNSFDHVILEDNIESQFEANEKERYYISQYDSYSFEHGYNMTLGGDTVSIDSLEKARNSIKQATRNKIDFIFCYELQKIFPNPTIALEYFLNNGFCNNYSHKNPIHRVIDKDDRTCFGYHFCRIINLPTFRPKAKEIANKSKGHKKKLIANSIGAYFSTCASLDGYVDKAYFISPIVDMAGLIENMMKASGVSENELKEKSIIGDLSWDYYVYVKEHPISWKAPTEIIYGSEDKLQSYETVSRFASRFNCGLTVMVGGEHWFHTEKQLRFLDGWLKEKEKI